MFPSLDISLREVSFLQGYIPNKIETSIIRHLRTNISVMFGIRDN